jgi:hypothetical protein
MKTAIMFVITMVLTAGPLYGEPAEQPPPTPVQEQPEVLTSGPVHEAFAEPVDLQVQPGLEVLSQPPADIVENLPTERPAGEQFVWVPGYWAWDSERNGYIWVSGCWRAAPPKMYWVPGYWAKSPGGWQWVAGFWAPAGVQDIEYLLAPPALDDVQPLGLPPSPDNIWVPPCWYWHNGQYIRRPGYWLVANPDWVWVPSHYIWTPRGYVFVGGRWDYSLGCRGVLFAPVYFPRHIHEHAGFSYSLSVVVDIGNLQFGLFTYPRYCHYYFGDYYDDAYLRIGIYPWFECEKRHTWYDPIYEHDRWRHHKTEPGWEEHQRHEYDLRRADRDLRPPRTYHEMETRLSRLPESKRREIQMAEPLSRVVADKRAPMKFEQIKTGARQKLSRQATDVRKFGEERSRWESSRGQRIEDRGQNIRPPSSGVSPLLTGTEGRGQKMEKRGQKIEEKGQTIRPQNEPDRVKIPPSPVVENRGMMSFFRKGPPSRPSDEQKADVKDTRRGEDTHKDRDIRSEKETRTDKDTRSEKDTRTDKGERNRGN